MAKDPYAVQRIRRALLSKLETPARHYRQRILNHVGKLLRSIRKGDVVLVEGRSRMSAIIGLFSKSHWTHVAMYVGDELIRSESPYREEILGRFGDDAGHMLVEAFSGEGVIATPIRKYQDHNIRICRPYGITSQDLERVVSLAIDHIGDHYDDQNILDIALMLLPLGINPLRKHSIKACLGSCSDFQVICSGMIAKCFQQVGYPIVPELQRPSPGTPPVSDYAYGSGIIMRHYSQIMPRDFDLSPNFEIVKFNIIGDGHFEYRSQWVDNPAPPARRT